MYAKQSLVAAALAALLATPALAAQDVATAAVPARLADKQYVRGNAKQAQALLDKAVAYVEKYGAERAYAAFNNQRGGFIQNDLYVFVIDTDGNSHANGGSPEGLVGMNILDMRDAGGKSFVREFVTAAKAGGGSVDYVWRNPLSNRIENKTALLRLVGKNMVGVGYYTPRSSAEQAKAFLDRAIAEINGSGAPRAFALFNDKKGPFVRDDLYVFVVGTDDGKFHAFGANPGLIGTEVMDMKDAAGKPIIRDMISMAKEKSVSTYDYVWRNPANNKVEPKQSFIQKVDQYLVGVGYYAKP